MLFDVRGSSLWGFGHLAGSLGQGYVGIIKLMSIFTTMVQMTPVNKVSGRKLKDRDCLPLSSQRQWAPVHFLFLSSLSSSLNFHILLYPYTCSKDKRESLGN